MRVKPITTRIFKENDNLFSFITSHVQKLSEGSIVVVTSKIVALSEGRTAKLGTHKEKESLVKKLSTSTLPTKYVWLTLTNGMFMANAGIDESNANGKMILLPRDSFKTASTLRKALKRKFRLKKLGVLITDSRTYPLRNGVSGVALGYAGFKGVKDYSGTRDLFGRVFKFAKTNIADCLATTAVLTMGEGKECQPLAIIEGAPVAFTEKINKKESFISLTDDMYKDLLKPLTRKKK